eukprot:CAMPEP_0178413402 /NCGR_PEP_ID=MMETSP0689_2-20121128/22509_1 /TAXON_ID=160604 /ORGANISM="Amphidinium massartii, Strain CS-259" /LENGTH=276 /DNA_ID=CAMNT_0020034673 /DNA_START=75 /DNA_END=905 /DNA_ORIENTATION=+
MAEEEGEPVYELYPQGADKPREEGSKQFTGFGRANYLNGDTYEGTYVEGYRQGKGTYVHKKNGDAYEGHYEENKKHGFGKTTYSSSYGDEEEGEEADRPKRGGSYLGYYTTGVRGCRKQPPGQERDPDAAHMSEGTFSYVNGDVYIGQWQEGKKHGSGTYSYAKDGTKLIGEWENGKITLGKWVLPNGTYYSGKFRYNKPYGKGVWVFKNGSQVTGDYQQREQPTEDDPPEDEEGVEKPDPQVWCNFKPEKDAVVQGGYMFGPKCGAITLVQPPLD